MLKVTYNSTGKLEIGMLAVNSISELAELLIIILKQFVYSIEPHNVMDSIPIVYYVLG